LDSIEKMKKNGEVVLSYVVPRHVECVIITKRGDIVYSDYGNHTVSSMMQDGKKVWTYTRPNLRFPYGLEKDSKDNIYVAGRDSGNIHVLSNEGDLVRIFENMGTPWFVAISPDETTWCVCSDKKDMTIYNIHCTLFLYVYVKTGLYIESINTCLLFNVHLHVCVFV
jgi:hypothetical protein